MTITIYFMSTLSHLLRKARMSPSNIPSSIFTAMGAKFLLVARIDVRPISGTSFIIILIYWFRQLGEMFCDMIKFSCEIALLIANTSS